MEQKGSPPAALFSWSSVDAVRRSLYSPSEHTFDHTKPFPQEDTNSGTDRTATGDLELPRRVRRSTRLPTDRARDRRGGRAGVALHRSRASREPRAGGPAQARSDEAARSRADRPYEAGGGRGRR